MNTRILSMVTLAALVAASFPAHATIRNGPSAPRAAHAKAISSSQYECSICHHRVNASEAKKLHYTCPVDHGTLIAVKPATPRKPH